MIEKLIGLEKISILQCQKLAKGMNSSTFTLCGPKGELECEWLDPDFGFFEIIGKEGFLRVEDFQFAEDIFCKNLLPGGYING